MRATLANEKHPLTNPMDTRQDFSISMLAANLYGLLIAIPFFVVWPALYGAVWGLEKLLDALLTTFQSWLFLVLLIGGLAAHEGLHAIGWQIFGRLPWGTVKFGFHLKTLTPYAHCPVPLPIRAYRLGGLLPGVALGLLPAALGVITGSGAWMLYGMLFSVAASGDLLSLWLLRRVPSDKFVEDHPSRVGCYVR